MSSTDWAQWIIKHEEETGEDVKLEEAGRVGRGEERCMYVLFTLKKINKKYHLKKLLNG